MNRQTLIVLLLVSVAMLASTTNERPRPEGLEPHTPTAIEWLLVYLNSENRDSVIDDDGFYSSFLIESPNSLELVVRYYPKLPVFDEKHMKEMIELQKEAFNILIKRYKYDKWAKLKVRVVNMSQPL